VAFRPPIAQGLALTFNVSETNAMPFYKKPVIASPKMGGVIVGGEAEANPEIPHFIRKKLRNLFIFKKNLRKPIENSQWQD